MPETCLLCRQIRGDEDIPGGFLWTDERALAFHLPPIDRNPEPHLGHVMVTTARHAAGFEVLSDEEAAAVGVAITRVARALRETLDLERIYSMVIGHGVPHLHVHVFPRYRGTPPEVKWLEVDEWEGAPHGGAAEIAELAARLRARIER
jgi:diadenosine tetraphosphate (Ap4A) HIT family hydrolase